MNLLNPELGNPKTNNMKRWIALLALAVAMTSYAQDAEVNFANNVFTPPRLVTFQHNGVPVTGTNFSAALLYGTSATSLTPHPVPARFRVSTTTQPGTWSGGIRTLTGIANIPGTVVWMQVGVYDNTQFTSYSAALAGGGVLVTSIIFPFTVPTPPLGPTSLDMVNFQMIPEPSVIALAAFGALALWTVKRRRGN
jgi:hypothetical protein